MTEKTDWRKALRARRLAMSDEERAAAAAAVVPHVLALPELRSGPVLLYVSVQRELPTGPLFDALWDAGVVTAVPWLDGGRMWARERRPGAALVAGARGIPTSDGPVIGVTWALCPGLGYDRRGVRLGYGGGNYDRFLADGAVAGIGLGFDDAVVDRLPAEAHDARMRAVVTPAGSWRPSDEIDAMSC